MQSSKIKSSNDEGHLINHNIIIAIPFYCCCLAIAMNSSTTTAMGIIKKALKDGCVTKLMANQLIKTLFNSNENVPHLQQVSQQQMEEECMGMLKCFLKIPNMSHAQMVENSFWSLKVLMCIP